MLALLSDPSAWASLFTMTIQEFVLGINNIITQPIADGGRFKGAMIRSGAVDPKHASAKIIYYGLTI